VARLPLSPECDSPRRDFSMEEQPKNFFSNPVVIIIGVVIVLLCCCTLILAAAGVAVYEIGRQVSTTMPELPSFDLSTPTSLPPAEITRTPSDQVSSDTLETLDNTIVPVNDLRDLACRLHGKCNIPETLPSGPYQVEARQTFWATNSDNHENFQVNATLQYLTDHAYFWVEDGVTVDQGNMKALVDAFETKIYPTDREFFGSEWTPGVDEDPHIYILYARGIGSNIAGYYSSVDELLPDAHKYSNAHEMFLFNADNTPLDDEYTYGVLAHEFQHMIHWKKDRNETSWLNEGSSELAVFLNGYNVGGADWIYVENPDLQLNAWVDSTSPDFSSHYGASFLFMAYFLDRFGEEATQALINQAANDMDSVDQTLRDVNALDSFTGQPISADDVFLDWVVANYLKDGSVADGRYIYHNYPDAPPATETETLACAQEPVNRTVNQYGVDYIALGCDGQNTLHFEGATATGLLPESAYSGKLAFWSNKGDESDMTLTREFDFSGVTGPIEMSYSTWYDLEADYDYSYVEASTDGTTWQILNTPSCTSEDPSGNSYGCGYNAKSGGGDTAQWIQEKADLSPYAGQKVQVRFEYVTDAAVNGEGLLLDDVSVPTVNYSTDFENDNGGWEAAGFARVENVLPQDFRLALIVKKSNGETTVTPVTLNAENVADVPLDLQSGDTAVLVVTGTTRFTRESAVYSLEVK
jgi:immune inhibitor A